MKEIIFEVRGDEVDGGYTARCPWYGIHTQGNTLEELRTMVKDASIVTSTRRWKLRRSSACISCVKRYWRMKLRGDV